MEENTENYKEISAEEFKAILRGEKLEYVTVDSSRFPPQTFININNLKVKQPIYIDTELLNFDLKITSGFFEEINFTEVFYKDELEDATEIIEDLLKKVKIRDYKKQMIVEVEGGIFNNFNIYSGCFECLKISEKVELNNLNIKEGNILKLSLSGQINKILIEGGIFTSIGTRQLKTDNFQIEGGIFKEVFSIYINQGYFQINQGVFECIIFYQGDANLYVREGTFKSEINISGENIEEITFAGGLFLGDISIYEDSGVKKLSIHGGIYEKTLHIQKKIQLYISEGDFKNKIFIELNENKEEKLKITSNNDAFLFYGGNISFLEILANTPLGYIKFSENCILKNTTITSNQNTYIHEVSLENNLYQGNFIKFDNLNIGYIHFSKFSNLGNIIFNSIKNKKVDIRFNGIEIKHSPTLKIHNSDLGKTTFIDCDFEGMELDFKSSKITEVFLAGTKMPKDITTDDNEQKRLGYGQLKKIYDNRGDTVTANEYFAKEMNVYLKKKELKSPERLNVWLNKFSSNHGTSWEKAFGVTIIFSIISFAIYGCCIGLSPASWFEVKNREIFWNYFGYILEYINPIRKPDSIVEGMNTYLNKTTGLNNLKANGFPMIWDGISRIFNSYFIYQLIQAFRKHRRGS